MLRLPLADFADTEQPERARVIAGGEGRSAPHVDLRPSVLIGRVYLRGGTYAEKSPFEVVFNVKLLGDDEALVEAMHGDDMSLPVMVAIGAQLHADYGVTVVIAMRNGHKRRYDMADLAAWGARLAAGGRL